MTFILRLSKCCLCKPILTKSIATKPFVVGDVGGDDRRAFHSQYAVFKRCQGFTENRCSYWCVIEKGCGDEIVAWVGKVPWKIRRFVLNSWTNPQKMWTSLQNHAKTRGRLENPLQITEKSVDKSSNNSPTSDAAKATKSVPLLAAGARRLAARHHAGLGAGRAPWKMPLVPLFFVVFSWRLDHWMIGGYIYIIYIYIYYIRFFSRHFHMLMSWAVLKISIISYLYCQIMSMLMSVLEQH